MTDAPESYLGDLYAAPPSTLYDTFARMSEVETDDQGLVTAFQWLNEQDGHPFSNQYIYFDFGEPGGSWLYGRSTPDRYRPGWDAFRARPRLHQRAARTIGQAWDRARVAVALRIAPELTPDEDDY